MKKYRKLKPIVSNALDDIDISVIKELQIDGRQSYLSLGKKIGASEGTVRNRVNSELKKELIKLKAVINPVKIGFEFSCIIGIEISIEKLDEAAAMLAEYPNVYFLAACTGSYDLLAILMFRNTVEFDSFIRKIIAKLPGIKRSQTFVNMSLIKTPWADDVDIVKLLNT